MSEYTSLSSLCSDVAGGASSEGASTSPSGSAEKHGDPGIEKRKSPGDGGSVSPAGVGVVARPGSRTPGSSRGGVGCPLAAPSWRAGRCRCAGCPWRVPSGCRGGGLFNLGLRGRGCAGQASAAHWVRGCAAAVGRLAGRVCGRGSAGEMLQRALVLGRSGAAGPTNSPRVRL